MFKNKLRTKLIRLAYDNPELRPQLLPMIHISADDEMIATAKQITILVENLAKTLSRSRWFGPVRVSAYEPTDLSLTNPVRITNGQRVEGYSSDGLFPLQVTIGWYVTRRSDRLIGRLSIRVLSGKLGGEPIDVNGSADPLADSQSTIQTLLEKLVEEAVQKYLATYGTRLRAASNFGRAPNLGTLGEFPSLASALMKQPYPKGVSKVIAKASPKFAIIVKLDSRDATTPNLLFATLTSNSNQMGIQGDIKFPDGRREDKGNVIRISDLKYLEEDADIVAKQIWEKLEGWFYDYFNE